MNVVIGCGHATIKVSAGGGASYAYMTVVTPSMTEDGVYTPAESAVAALDRAAAVALIAALQTALVLPQPDPVRDAAPDLLEALEECRKVLGVIGRQYQRAIGPYATQAQKAGQIAAAAIAKAEGRS